MTIKFIHINIYNNAIEVSATNEFCLSVVHDVYPINAPHEVLNDMTWWRIQNIPKMNAQDITFDMNYHGDYIWDFKENKLVVYTHV